VENSKGYYHHIPKDFALSGLEKYNTRNPVKVLLLFSAARKANYILHLWQGVED
jgi:hypothetical protein